MGGNSFRFVFISSLIPLEHFLLFELDQFKENFGWRKAMRYKNCLYYKNRGNSIPLDIEEKKIKYTDIFINKYEEILEFFIRC